MKALCLSLLLAVAAAAAVPAEPGPLLVPGQDDAGWRELFAALAAQGPVWSAFTEHRWFSVKKEPVVLSGELRHSAARGLSLHYTAPEEQLAVIDARGVLLRSAKGRTREIAADPHHPQADAALLPVMRGDLPELEKSFEVQPARATTGGSTLCPATLRWPARPAPSPSAAPAGSCAGCSSSTRPGNGSRCSSGRRAPG